MVTVDHAQSINTTKPPMKHLLKYNDNDIVVSEYLEFKKRIRQLNPNTPYYVYSLCYPDGNPFYIGKGKNRRAFDHLLSSNVSDAIKSVIPTLNGEAPIVHIIKDNLTEQQALDLEEENIIRYGRQRFEGGQLVNIMPSGNITLHDVHSETGKLGGQTTRSNNLGIFSPTYDRSAQSKLNHAMGLLDHVDYVAAGTKGGATSASTKVGIHNPEYAHMRTKWASDAAKQVKNRGGCCTKEWQEANKDRQRENASKAGKAGGKITGNTFWWTDGVDNKRSLYSPGENWTRGMSPSTKKLANLFGRNKVTVTPSNSDNKKDNQ